MQVNSLHASHCRLRDLLIHLSSPDYSHWTGRCVYKARPSQNRRDLAALLDSWPDRSLPAQHS